MPRTGPWAALASQMSSVTAIFLVSPVRVMEMALRASDPFPASMKRLFDEGSQAITSGVIASWNRALTNLIASRVCFELSTRLPSGSWTDAPNEYMIVRKAIPVSISAERPMPTGMPVFFLILAPPMRMSSQVFGLMPTSSQRSFR